MKKSFTDLITFFDVFGTIINNKQDSKSINKIFSKIKIIGNTKIIIVSNSSRSSDQIKKLLKRKKINIKLIDKVFTSSEVASKFLLKTLNSLKNFISVEVINIYFIN